MVDKVTVQPHKKTITKKINSNGHTFYHLTGLCGYIREKGYEALLYVCYVDPAKTYSCMKLQRFSFCMDETNKI